MISYSSEEWIKKPTNDWEYPLFKVIELKPKTNRYCVCVFVINEGDKVRKQLKVMSRFQDQADIVVADGGSTDGSLDPNYLVSCNVRSLLIKEGPGKLSSQMRMAFVYALQEGYEGVIVIDGNNKDDTSAIADFINALEEGYDHIQGSRFIPGGKAINTPAARLLGLHIIHAPLISMAARFRYTDTTNGFRAYSAKLLSDPAVGIFRNIFMGYELHYYLAIKAARSGYKVKELPVTRTYPKHGKTPTKISPLKGNLLILKTLINAVLGKYDLKSK